MFRVECSCGLSSGTVEDEELADEILEAHESHCDEHAEVTPAPIPGHQ